MSDDRVNIQPFNYKTMTFLEWVREIEGNPLFEGKPPWLKLLLAGRSDVLASYVDARANNNMFHSMFTKQNVYNFAWYLDYYPPTPSPASGNLQFTLKAATVLPITIPKEELVAKTVDIVGDEPVTFTAIADHTFNALTENVEMREGQLHTDTMAYITTGDEFEEFTVERTGFIKGLASVSIDGVTFNETERFYDRIATDNYFRVVYHYDGFVNLRSGDGNYGSKFPVGHNPVVTAWYGGGTRGNVAIGKVTRYDGNHPDVDTVTNTTRMTGGSGEMSTDRIKLLAPLFVQAQDRAVSLKDFEALSVAFSGVERAYVQPNHYGVLSARIQIVPSGGGSASSVLKTDLQVYLTGKTLLSGIFIIVDTADYQVQNLQIECKIEEGYTFADREPYIHLASRMSISEVLVELKELLTAEGGVATVTYINSLWGYIFDTTNNVVVKLIADMIRAATVFEWGERLFPNVFYTLIGLIPGVGAVDVAIPSTIVSGEVDKLLTHGTIEILEADSPERSVTEILVLTSEATSSIIYDRGLSVGVGFDTYTISEVV